MRVRASRVRARLGGVPARARACTCAVVELRAVCTDILHSPARVPVVEVARGCYQTANMIPDRFWPSTRAHVRSAASFPDGRAADPGGRQTAAVGDQAATSIEGHVTQAADRLASTRARLAVAACDARSAGTASPVPKYISSGVCPRNAECGSTWLYSWT